MSWMLVFLSHLMPGLLLVGLLVLESMHKEHRCKVAIRRSSNRGHVGLRSMMRR
jgi:hypothetical protein